MRDGGRRERIEAMPRVGAARALIRTALPGSPVLHALDVQAAAGTYAHMPRALIRSVCGDPASLDAAPAPEPPTDPQEPQAMTLHDHAIAIGGDDHPLCRSFGETRP